MIAIMTVSMIISRIDSMKAIRMAIKLQFVLIFFQRLLPASSSSKDRQSTAGKPPQPGEVWKPLVDTGSLVIFKLASLHNHDDHRTPPYT